MIEEGSFVELAKLCVRTCRMFGPATKGSDTEIVRKEQIEDFARCVGLSELS